VGRILGNRSDSGGTGPHACRNEEYPPVNEQRYMLSSHGGDRFAISFRGTTTRSADVRKRSTSARSTFNTFVHGWYQKSLDVHEVGAFQICKVQLFASHVMSMY
jgi:hypothetical protein